MRLTLTLLCAVCSCAHLPPKPQADACERAARYTPSERLDRPCEFAADLATCSGLSPEDRDRIAQRCVQEQQALESLRGTGGYVDAPAGR